MASTRQHVTLRTHRAGDVGWIVERHGELYWQEYGWNSDFEALVAEIGAAFLRTCDSDRERCWIAEIDGRRAGSVMCVRVDDETAKLRLLLVEPWARGFGVGGRLIDECITFARARGYRKLVLWTNDVLIDARRLYERRGFTLIQSESHTNFGHDLVAQTWSLDLASPITT